MHVKLDWKVLERRSLKGVRNQWTRYDLTGNAAAFLGDGDFALSAAFVMDMGGGLLHDT